MCCCDIGDSPAFASTTFPRTRKPRKCEECSATIAPGERYSRLAQKWDERISVWVTCTDCHEWAEGLMRAQREDASCDCVGYCLGGLWECIGEFIRERYGYQDDEEEDAA